MLRNVHIDDLYIFFEQQLDPKARWMCAFGNDPDKKDLFVTKWKKMLVDPTVLIKTIILNDEIIGNIMSYKSEISYWIGKEFWGKGLATKAVVYFLTNVEKKRPIYARVAEDNLGSRRVLTKCNFEVVGEEKGFSSTRVCELSELVFMRNS
ncbi:GNAT family N-acetyltransferase [Candidatus Uabimicrobium sp. HlEnr_7]|uniref:GNAT family N-acetyltransferase n=1 Tax=Candidatus Uabimicrobium helgolandensis TaxID=3095367 RepID=UPI0035590EFD